MAILPNPDIKLKVVYEDDGVLVVDKPANLTVHPNRPNQDNTLANGLVAKYPKIKSVGDNLMRPGIVHRLDKDTSGLMIIAKNNPAYRHLKKQFQEHKIIKHYLALVVGRFKDKKGIITKAISISKKDRKKRSALFDEKAKRAVTRYEVKQEFKNYTLLKVIPQTGRTHQIRIHLSSIGHPLAGDKQYRFRRQKDPAGLSRQFLHAFYLKFQLPDGMMKPLKSELPKDLKSTLLFLEQNG